MNDVKLWNWNWKCFIGSKKFNYSNKLRTICKNACENIMIKYQSGATREQILCQDLSFMNHWLNRKDLWLLKKKGKKILVFQSFSFSNLSRKVESHVKYSCSLHTQQTRIPIYIKLKDFIRELQKYWLFPFTSLPDWSRWCWKLFRLCFTASTTSVVWEELVQK